MLNMGNVDGNIKSCRIDNSDIKFSIKEKIILWWQKIKNKLSGGNYGN